MMVDMYRPLKPGNPSLCGEVPLSLYGVVSTFISGSPGVQPIKTLGDCKGPSPDPAPALMHLPSQVPYPAKLSTQVCAIKELQHISLRPLPPLVPPRQPSLVHTEMKPSLPGQSQAL